MSLANDSRYCVLILCVILLSACDSEPAEDELEKPKFVVINPVPRHLEEGMPELKQKEMLSMTDNTHPAKWLLSRYQQQAGYDTARSVFYYQGLLEQITAHVHEDKRVVANRVVQITNKLNENGFPTDQDEILEGFASYLADVEQTYVFGEIVANYSILRQQNRDHETAIKLLFELLQRS